ncbi:MAG: hypothetical protein ACOC0P_06435 [Planctomycetota bacterium]
MQYEDRVPYSGTPSEAVNAVANMIVPHRFHILKQTESVIEATGPGMRSTKQDPLTGATVIRFWVDDGEATLQAELGGVRFMQRFVFFFPMLLGVGLYILFAILSRGQFQGPITLSVFGPMIIWLFIAPLPARSIISRTVRALEFVLIEATGYEYDEEPWAEEVANKEAAEGDASQWPDQDADLDRRPFDTDNRNDREYPRHGR